MSASLGRERLTPPRIITRFDTIEALRAVAAISVVLYHVSRHLDRDVGWPDGAYLLHSLHVGVDLFFVLSGFIIARTHGRDIGRSDRTLPFIRKRFIRIWPMYWLCLAVTVLMTVLGGHWPGLNAIFWSATLLPLRDHPIVDIAWTLQCEFVFYTVFAALIELRQVGVILVGLWLAAMLATAVGLNLSLPAPMVNLFGLQFFMGMAAAVAIERPRMGQGWMAALVGGVVLLTSAVAETRGELNGYGDTARVAYGLGAALIVAGLARLELSRPMAVPALLTRLGSASYSIYLFQFVWIALIGRVYHAVQTLLPASAGLVMISGVAVAGGVLLSERIEQPGLRWLRRNLTLPRHPGVTVHAEP